MGGGEGGLEMWLPYSQLQYIHFFQFLIFLYFIQMRLLTVTKRYIVSLFYNKSEQWDDRNAHYHKSPLKISLIPKTVKLNKIWPTNTVGQG